MIRRAANLIGTGDGGFVLNWFIQTDSAGNEQSLMTFETIAAPTGGNPGVVSIQPAANIRFSDGSPDPLPVIE